MLLAADDIVVHYGRLAALRGVSVEVDEGEIVCIVGPNGAGKSTLLLTLSGVLAPTRGRISFAGEPITGLKPEKVARKGISLVPEGRHVFSTLTVWENLRVGTGMRRDKDEVERDLKTVLRHFPVLAERLNAPAGKLSGGEQQQLVLARALMAKPRLMTVDEPSLGLAPKIVDQVYAILRDLRQRQGLTLLIVEQSTHRALQVADRIYVLRGGSIQLMGAAKELEGGQRLKEAYFGFGAGAGQPREAMP